MNVSEATAWLQERSRRRLAGVFAFGDSPAMADELLAFIRQGTKRATVGDAAEARAGDEPFPKPGMRWGILDGDGRPQVVIETVEVRTGPLRSVDAAFAWDEGEHDRTLEGWLEGHRAYFRRQGVADPAALELVFERFRVVWPEPDTTVWLGDGVRELRHDERPWMARTLTERWGPSGVVSRGRLIDPASLPGIVVERDGERVGLLTFRVRPGGDAEIVTVDAFPPGQGIGARLLAGAVELGRRNGWGRLWLITTNDNTRALRAYQRHGFDLVALREWSSSRTPDRRRPPGRGGPARRR